MVIAHRSELAKENEEWRRKNNDLEKRIREIDRKNNEFIFTLEKEQAKWTLEKENLNEKVKNLEESLEWEKQRNAQLKNEANKTKKAPGLYNSQISKIN